MAILMIDYPMNLRHRVIVSPKKGMKISQSQISSCVPSQNEFFLSVKTQHFQSISKPIPQPQLLLC